MVTLFGDSPENHHIHRRLGWTAEQVMDYRRRLLSDLEKKLAPTHVGAQMIISAEGCWRMSQIEFERVHAFMADRDYAIRIIAYIRPWKEWLESNFQQRVKMGQHTFELGPADYSVVSDYYKRIRILETVFGAAQVQIFKYDPGIFPEGCVVRDFCQHLGIHFEPNRIRRANDSLKLPALQLLYAYYKFGPGYGTGQQALTDNNLMIQQLSQLGGPSLRFHSTLIEPLLQELATQRPWIEQRLGVPFAEDIYRDDDAMCIREEADLFNFSPAALLWLAAATGNDPIRPTSGHQAARAVSKQIASVAPTSCTESPSCSSSRLRQATTISAKTTRLASIKKPKRHFSVYDVFGMIPPPTKEDTQDAHDRYRTIVEGKSIGIGGVNTTCTKRTCTKLFNQI